MKILLLIQSASHPIFQNNIKALIDGYRDTIEKYHLPVDVVTFCGKPVDDPEDGSHRYIEDLVLDIDERRVADTLFAAIKRYVDDQRYDFIVKTNTNTVVNLQMLVSYLSSGFYNPGDVLSALYILAFDNDDRHIIYPSGMFMCFGTDMWRRMLEVVDEALKAANTVFTLNDSIRHTKEEGEGRPLWYGYSDEFMVGLCYHLVTGGRYNYITLKSTFISTTKHEIFGSIIGKDVGGVDTNTLVTNCKVDIDGDFYSNTPEEQYRTTYEHIVISMMCMLYGMNKVGFNDVESISKTKLFYVN